MQIAITIAITSVALAIVLFLCAFLASRAMLRMWMQTAKGQIPPKIDPVKAVKDAVMPDKPDPATAELLQGHKNMMSYDGFLPEERR